ncbi:MAG TPA: phenylalanine--tRNA ligase subunit beta [Actinomycetota bacterium]|nr:phenylalanine--tRNA ligase subunit beta [Actinomycetota bacterium]
MRVPLSWLRELSPTSLSAEEVADLLTRHGVEVDRILRPWDELSGVLVARVEEVRDHPQADRLCVARVAAGGAEREVVVGVRNMKPGDLVPYAAPGATLPGMAEKIERRELRGVASEGMLCSPKELGVSTDHTGILILDEELEPGSDLKEALGLDEAVLDIEVFPNRPDLLSIAGVAREVAAVTGADLMLPDTSVKEGPEKADDAATVEVKDSERCPRYLARVIRGVRHATAPVRAQVRLAAAGMRPLSAVVDATNYVMLELGQPLHPFDLRRLAGPGIVVRPADDGERLVTLDGEERTLGPEDLVIADVEGAVAIAGVMGGGDSEVSAETTDVLIESAYFQPVGILRTARRLGLRTEASIRFERGADPEAVGPAAARAAALATSWAGGTVLAGAVDVGQVPPRKTVAVRPQRAAALLGTDLSAADVREALARLRLPASEEGDTVAVEVPSARVDLEREVDLIEEVARLSGYDHVPSTLPGVRQGGGLTAPQRLARRLRDLLAGVGLVETRSWSFASSGDLELFPGRAGVPVANPVSEDEGHLRTSLLPGLLRAARRNVAHRRPSVRLFEIGATFEMNGDVTEEDRLVVLLTGPAAEEWPGEPRDQDFLDLKGVIEHLMAGLGIDDWTLGKPLDRPWHAARSAVLHLDEDPIGEVGELHAETAAAFDLTARVAAMEVRLEPFLAAASTLPALRDVSRFPPVHRDLAFVVGEDVPARDVRAALVDAAGALLDRVLLFDVFEGDPIPTGKKSLAFSVDFRAPDRTLTDQEADDLVNTISARLAKEVDAELRAG